VREYIKSAGSTARDASVLGHDRLSATAAHAALANGASGHAMDYDDTQLSSSPDRVFGLLTHPTVPVLACGARRR
jgi:2-methylcitrate dehydratase PrpD